MLRSKITQLTVLAVSMTSCMMFAETRRATTGSSRVSAVEIPMFGRDGHGVKKSGLLGQDGHGTRQQEFYGADGHGTQQQPRMGADGHGIQPKPVIGGNGHGIRHQEEPLMGVGDHDFTVTGNDSDVVDLDFTVPGNRPVGGGFAGGTVQIID